MAQGALIANVAGGAAGALGGIAEAQAQRRQARINAYISETRALQTGTAMSENLMDELATLRTTLAQNGQQGGMEFWREILRVRGREQRIAMSNERQLAADYRDQARSISPLRAALPGLVQAGRGYADLRNYNMWRGG